MFEIIQDVEKARRDDRPNFNIGGTFQRGNEVFIKLVDTKSGNSQDIPLGPGAQKLTTGLGVFRRALAIRANAASKEDVTQLPSTGDPEVDKMTPEQARAVNDTLGSQNFITQLLGDMLKDGGQPGQDTDELSPAERALLEAIQNGGNTGTPRAPISGQ